MTADAFPGRTLVVGVGVAIVPLAVQVVGHVDDVIDLGPDPLDREAPQVPVRGGCGNRHRLARPDLLLQEREEAQVANAVGLLANGLAIDVDVRGLDCQDRSERQRRRQLK